MIDQGVDPAIGDELYRLNPRMVKRSTMPKGSWKYPRPPLTANFALLEAKRLLNLMDYALLQGGSNFLVVAKKGSDQRPAVPEEVTQPARGHQARVAHRRGHRRPPPLDRDHHPGPQGAAVGEQAPAAGPQARQRSASSPGVRQGRRRRRREDARGDDRAGHHLRPPRAAPPRRARPLRRGRQAQHRALPAGRGVDLVPQDHPAGHPVLHRLHPQDARPRRHSSPLRGGGRRLRLRRRGAAAQAREGQRRRPRDDPGRGPVLRRRRRPERQRRRTPARARARTTAPPARIGAPRPRRRARRA